MSLKPIIKWAGGKRRLTAEITDAICTQVWIGKVKQDMLYVEPFAGGAAFMLDLEPRRAIINDKNTELINMYRVIRDKHTQLLDALLVHEVEDSREYYNYVRSLDRYHDIFAEMTPVKRAARFIYLVKAGYGGIWRVNKKGEMNMPYNPHHSRDIRNETGIRALHDYLSGNDIDIQCGDYADTLKDLPDNAFVYLDPPYMPITNTGSFKGYTADSFDYKEQVRLRDECVKLRDRGIPFVESNSDTEAIRELYKDFTIKTVQVRRNISSNPAKRGTVSELLITA